jgi:hypothetical protein
VIITFDHDCGGRGTNENDQINKCCVIIHIGVSTDVGVYNEKRINLGRTPFHPFPHLSLYRFDSTGDRRDNGRLQSTWSFHNVFLYSIYSISFFFIPSISTSVYIYQYQYPLVSYSLFYSIPSFPSILGLGVL